MMIKLLFIRVTLVLVVAFPAAMAGREMCADAGDAMRQLGTLAGFVVGALALVALLSWDCPPDGYDDEEDS